MCTAVTEPFNTYDALQFRSKLEERKKMANSQGPSPSVNAPKLKNIYVSAIFK